MLLTRAHDEKVASLGFWWGLQGEWLLGFVCRLQVDHFLIWDFDFRWMDDI